MLVKMYLIKLSAVSLTTAEARFSPRQGEGVMVTGTFTSFVIPTQVWVQRRRESLGNQPIAIAEDHQLQPPPKALLARGEVCKPALEPARSHFETWPSYFPFLISHNHRSLIWKR